MELDEFGRWRVLDRKGSRWLCRCKCGTERCVDASSLRRGVSKSCGCAKREVAYPDMPVLTADVLRQLLDYDKDTGHFTWRAPLANRIRPGDKAGQRDGHGYRQITVCNTAYLAHRLAWLYMAGAWPPDQIDHINGDRSDNRIANLRLATSSENGCNVRVRTNNKSGVTGVHWYPRYEKWVAVIKSGGKAKNLGYFADKEDAIRARQSAEMSAFGSFSPLVCRVKKTGAEAPA